MRMNEKKFQFPKELATIYGINSFMLQQLNCFGSILVEDRLAPTTIRDPERVLFEHIVDALTVLPFHQLQAAKSVIDVGSGCGVPGIVLAIVQPHVQYVLLDSGRRKVDFLASVLSRVTLPNVEVVHGRVEDYAHGHAQCFDFVLARALAALPVLVEYAAPLLKLHGILVAWKGDPSTEEVNEAQVAAGVVGLDPAGYQTVTPWPKARDRRLYFYRKTAETPASFPRRPGIAAKRPLGVR